MANEARKNPNPEAPKQRSKADIMARSEASEWFGIGLDEEDAKKNIAMLKEKGLL